MESTASSQPHPLLFLTLLSVVITIVSSSTDGPSTSNCSPSSTISTFCGGISITYPFSTYYASIPPRPSAVYCAYPGFMILCSGDTPILSIGSGRYTVTEINYLSNTINLVDTDVLTSPNKSCPRVRHNLNLSSPANVASRLTYTGVDANLTFFFNCSVNDPRRDLISCLTYGNKSSYVFHSTDATAANYVNLTSMCQDVVVAPVMLDYMKPNLADPIYGFGESLKNGFQLGWLPGALKGCAECERSGGQCGFNQTSLQTAACFCSDGMRPRDCSDNYGSSKISTRKDIFIGVGSGMFLWLCLIAFLLSYKKSRDFLAFWKNESETSPNVESFIQKYGSLNTKWYKYSEVKKMTKSFTHKLGKGGYGIVYKGNLPSGHPVAVKILAESKGNGEEFINEVASISSTSHVNIVRLLGFCLDGSKRALIYDYMPNGSLEKFICTDKSHIESTLSWEKLFEIVLGVARGLEYLHRGCNTRIIHFDIKPHNILLDQDYCPKISDFGLAKLCTSKESIISLAGARGTIGYIAPEVFSRNFGAVTSKSDVYSYGMMVLEMVGGRKNVEVTTMSSSEAYFPQYLYNNINNFCVEACGDNGEAIEVVRKMILIGLWCIQIMPDHRPSMSKVVNMLEGYITDLQLPPKP